MAHWGYTQENGPHTWNEIAPAGKGKRQSPIDIQPARCKCDVSLANRPLKWSYTPSNAKTLTNNGHSAQVTYDSEGSSLEGGPLDSRYKLAQFHLHWGKSDGTGSEHRVNGKMYAAELHLVHWNADKFSNFGEACSQDGGLCVLGVFLKVGAEHQGFKQMTNRLQSVQYSGDTIDINDGLDPALLLPSDTSKYWTYPGSLTTPPLYESVTWVVFQEPIEVSEEQMEALRSLHQYKNGETLEDEFNGMIVENYRPPLPVGDRTVRATFESDIGLDKTK